MVKVRYIGDAPADTLIGRVLPGEVREVKKEIADKIVGHFFIIDEDGIIEEVAEEEDVECDTCPKEKEE